MITLEQFENLPLGQVFATGVIPNSPEGIYMTNSNEGELLRWVAKKGWGHDWAVYCHWATNSEEYVTQSGDKVTTKTYIQRCVPCDDDVFKLYRY